MYGFIRADLKQRAQNFLREYYFYALVVCFIYSIQNFMDSGINFNFNFDFSEFFGIFGEIFSFGFFTALFIPWVLISILFSIAIGIFIFPALEVGMAKYFIGDEPSSIVDVFFVFKSPYYFNIIKTMVIKNIITFFGYFLVIPGLILDYRWCMVKYILVEHPELDYHEVLSLSSSMTRGNCMDIFVLDLSFILWKLVAGIFGNVGKVLLMPYIQATYAQLFYVLKDQCDEYAYRSPYE